jgi:hypothetical protein
MEYSLRAFRIHSVFKSTFTISNRYFLPLRQGFIRNRSTVAISVDPVFISIFYDQIAELRETYGME